MRFLKNLFATIAQYFVSGAAQRDFILVEKYIVRALPYIDIAATIVVKLTPTGIDDMMWDYIKKRYPKLFDGSITSKDELDLYALGVAADILKNNFPELTTSAARAAVQLAWITKKG